MNDSMNDWMNDWMTSSIAPGESQLEVFVYVAPCSIKKLF